MWDGEVRSRLLSAGALILLLVPQASPGGSPPLRAGAACVGPTSKQVLGPVHAIPLTVRNWLPWDRRGEPVSSGVPLPPGVAWDVDELRLLEGSALEVPAQFSVLARWADGSLRWVLVDLQADVEAGGESTYYLEAGAQPRGVDTPLEVEDLGDALIVRTGPLSFEVGRSGSPLLGPFRLDLDGDGFPEAEVAEGGDVVVVGEDGGEYLAGLGGRVVEVEEAGPLRVSILVRGSHVSPAGGTLLNYTLRIHAFAWKSYLRVYYAEENVLPCLNDGSGQPNCLRLGSPNSVRFEGVELRLNLTRGPDPSYAVPADGRILRGDLTGAALLYQDSSGGPDWDRWPGVSFRGYVVRVGERDLHRGNRSEGWADLSYEGFGLTVGKRYFWESYPSSIELLPSGQVRVGLMPTQFSAPFEHRAGERKTHELVLNFHPGRFTEGRAREVVGLMDPMQARAPAELYLEYGLYERWPPYQPLNPWLTCYELNNLAAVNGTAGPYADNLFDARERVDFYGWMHFGDVRVVDEDGGTGQSNLQYDFEYGMLVQSLRLLGGDDVNSRRWWLLGEQAARHTADMDVLHVHWGDPSQPSSYWIRWSWGGMFWHTPHGEPGLENPHRGSSPSLEFQFARGLFLYYYLTGYRPAWEAAMELSENAYWRVTNGPGEPGYSGTTGDEARAPANALMILLAAYQATWDERFLQAAGRVVEESHFDRRWYASGPSEGMAGRSVAPWQQAMLMVALGEYLDLIRWTRGRTDQAAKSSLLGYARWMLRYAYHRVGDDAFSGPHFVYRWWGDGRVSDWSPGGGANAWMLVISDAFVYAWEYSGNQTYLQVALQQFLYGSRYFWYEGNPVGQFATGKQHAILSTSGFMASLLLAWLWDPWRTHPWGPVYEPGGRAGVGVGRVHPVGARGGADRGTSLQARLQASPETQTRVIETERLQTVRRGSGRS